MSRRQAKRKPVPKLSHEQAIEQLVEYEFGRLSPIMSAAVEAHVRSCPICQRQGLNHAVTEKRQIERHIRHLKPARRRLSKRGRLFILVLLLLIIGQLAIIRISQGGLLGKHSGGSTSPTPTSGASTSAPQTLAPTQTFTQSSTGGNLSFSPDGKAVAGIVDQGSGPTVGIWDAGTGKVRATFAWTGSSTPGALAWSPDGKLLVAADGSLIGVWNAQSQTQLWLVSLPSSGNIRIYDSQSGSIVQRPDVASTFANGSVIAWSSSGQLPSTVAGGAQPRITSPGSAQVGLWESSGSHLFPGASGTSVRVGFSAADGAARQALVSWSPDGRYLLWATTSQPVSLSSSSTATTGASSGIPVPDSIVGAEVGALAQSGKGDALEWFSPDGKLLAQCDRSATSTSALTIWNRATSQPVSVVNGVCGQLSIGSLTWSATSETFALSVAHKPVALYVVTLSQ